MEKKIPLSELPLNESAIVNSVKCKKNLINRIFDFGIVKNSVITPIYRSPFGDPTAYLIKNAVVALRKKDCKDITVTPL